MVTWILQGTQGKKCKNIQEKNIKHFFQSNEKGMSRIWSRYLNVFKLIFSFLYQLSIVGDNINISNKNNVAHYVVYKDGCCYKIYINF